MVGIYAVFIRYGKTKTQRFSSFREAARHLLWGGDAGELYGIGIVQGGAAVLPTTTSATLTYEDHIAFMEQVSDYPITAIGTYYLDENDKIVIETSKDLNG